jgi:uncharacterized membrane protein YidH (DUF202 family)
MDASDLVQKIAVTFINPIITLLVAGGVLLFLFGVVEFIQGAESDTARDTGKRHMMWGLIGIFIMVSAFAILKVFSETIWG